MIDEIILKDKTLSEIKNAITGHWQLHYSFGGLFQRIDYTNNYIDFFNFADSIKWTDNGNLYLLDKSYYDRVKSIYGDSTFLIKFQGTNIQYEWTVDRIRNDTLIIKDDHSNPFTYYLTKK